MLGGFQGGKLNIPLRGTPNLSGRRGGSDAREVDFCTTSSNELHFSGVFWFDVILGHLEAILRPKSPSRGAKAARDRRYVRSTTPQNGRREAASLNVTFVRGFPRGKTQLTPSGYPKPVGSAGLIGSRGSLFLHDVIERTQFFAGFLVRRQCRSS